MHESCAAFPHGDLSLATSTLTRMISGKMAQAIYLVHQGGQVLLARTDTHWQELARVGWKDDSLPHTSSLRHHAISNHQAQGHIRLNSPTHQLALLCAHASRRRNSSLSLDEPDFVQEPKSPLPSEVPPSTPRDRYAMKRVTLPMLSPLPHSAPVCRGSSRPVNLSTCQPRPNIRMWSQSYTLPA